MVGGSRQMPFAVSTVWTEPKDNTTDYCLCLKNITGIISKSRRTVKYSDFQFAMRPVQHSEELLVPKPSENPTFSNDNSDSDQNHGQQEGGNVDCDLTFEASCSSNEPQGGFNDLVRGFYFVKKKAKLSISRLHG
jgi:hypothetical protein